MKSSEAVRAGQKLSATARISSPNLASGGVDFDFELSFVYCFDSHNFPARLSPSYKA